MIVSARRIDSKLSVELLEIPLIKITQTSSVRHEDSVVLKTKQKKTRLTGSHHNGKKEPAAKNMERFSQKLREGGGVVVFSTAESVFFFPLLP